MAWHEETDECFRVRVVGCFVELGMDICFGGGEKGAMVVEGEGFVFVAEKFDYGERTALVDLGGVESDGEVDEEDGVEEGFAAGGENFLCFSLAREGWRVGYYCFCSCEEGGNGWCGEDVEEG